MAKALIDPILYKKAVSLSHEIQDSAALNIGKFDQSRWPALTPKAFNVSGATVAVSPDCSYRFLKKAIDAAKQTIVIYIYDISAPYLVDLLTAAKARGVKIRSMYDATQHGAAELQILKAVGQTKAAPSSGDRQVFTVCHQKFLVIDGKRLIIESANWAKTSVPEITTAGAFKKGNREWLIQFDSRDLAEWFADLFNKDWKIPASAGAALTTPPPDLPMVSVRAAVHPPATIFNTELIADSTAVVTPIVSPNNYLSEVKKLLANAKMSILIQQQYVLAGPGVKDLIKIIARKRADAAAFDIRVITSAAFAKNWEGTVATLRSAGLEDTIRAVNPESFTHCHNKGVLVDGTSVVISSTNWSSNSISKAREAGVLIRSKKIAKYYGDVFEIDWSEGLTADQVGSSLTEMRVSESL